MGPTYSFRAMWFVRAPVAEIHAALVDLEHYPQWWPQVRAVASLGADDAIVLCRSALPYTLELRLHAVSRALPTVEVAIDGHLRGWVRWTVLAPPEEGLGCWLRWEQEVTVQGWLAVPALVARPLLRWNHARMMAGGHDGLVARLEGSGSPADR